jgi:asparagine synthase (glutamine-hydrolysing)
MCGIAGFFQTSGWTATEAEQRVRDMLSPIRHRGPDDSGFWGEAGVALGHARLSIVDLSPAGHQPMVSADQRLVIVFNGEIYNQQELRDELAATGRAPAWRGHSDTETLLAVLAAWGVEAGLRRCIGMFAFALWNRADKTLILARDRIGEKPLYYGWQGQGQGATFLFGSELKALRAHPQFAAPVNRAALPAFLRHNYIPAPQSIYEGISKLPSGCFLEISDNQREPRIQPYWSAREVMVDSVRQRQDIAPGEAVDALESLLKSAVARQMVADVPLGAFLSGGVDSSTIVALMQDQSARPVKTFTIGFHEAGYDEAGHAKQIAAHLGTDHTELYVTARETIDVIPRLPTIYDEPFADSSQIPTFLVAELARRHVTVSLSGDGGDELFGGYNRYTMGASLWRQLGLIPVPVRRVAARLLTALPTSGWDRLGDLLGLPRLGDRLHKGAGVLVAGSIDQLYLALISHWDQPQAVVKRASDSGDGISALAAELSGLDGVERMMALDLMTYLVDDILVKVDRAAMAVGLESRIPMLDHRVVEFAWRLPQDLKLRGGTGKWILRQVLYRHVPKALMDRPKMGFGIPLGTWLRGPLKPWAEALLNPSRLEREGFFDPASIQCKWLEHQAGVRNWSYHLWSVLMFQAWLENQRVV